MDPAVTSTLTVPVIVWGNPDDRKVMRLLLDCENSGPAPKEVIVVENGRAPLWTGLPTLAEIVRSKLVGIVVALAPSADVTASTAPTAKCLSELNNVCISPVPLSACEPTNELDPAIPHLNHW